MRRGSETAAMTGSASNVRGVWVQEVQCECSVPVFDLDGWSSELKAS